MDLPAELIFTGSFGYRLGFDSPSQATGRAGRVAGARHGALSPSADRPDRRPARPGNLPKVRRSFPAPFTKPASGWALCRYCGSLRRPRTSLGARQRKRAPISGTSVYGIDGTTLRVADSPENRAHFWRHADPSRSQRLSFGAACGLDGAALTPVASRGLWPLIPTSWATPRRSFRKFPTSRW